MSNVEPLLERNRAFAATGAHKDLMPNPKRNMFVITCFDSRVDPAHLLGTDLGDLVVMRNEGGRVTKEIIEELTFAGILMEALQANPFPSGEVALIHHTNCMTSYLADDNLRNLYADRIGADAADLLERAVLDPVATVTQDVAVIRAATSVPQSLTISGHVYDVETGLISTVLVDEPRADDPDTRKVPNTGAW
ncbi:MAG: carbonic anhydrase [Acidimicrobiales bacterium]